MFKQKNLDSSLSFNNFDSIKTILNSHLNYMMTKVEILVISKAYEHIDQYNK